MTKSQLDKFKQAARELETNDDPAEFDRKMRRAKLQTQPPPKAAKAKKGKPGE
jgi:hypothetical protein